MRVKGWKISIVLGLLPKAAALYLWGHNRWESNRAGEASAEVLAALKVEITSPAPVPTPTINPEYAASPTPEPVRETEEQEEVEPSPSPEMATQEIQGYDYIAVLYIPVLELELPVMDQWDYTRLTVAPCRYTGSIYSNDLVIAGHAYETHFWPLHYLSVGDEVFLTDMGGNRLRYSVSEIQTLEDTAIGDMVNSGYDLTLFTCTNNGIARLAVRCSRG